MTELKKLLHKKTGIFSRFSQEFSPALHVPSKINLRDNYFIKERN